MNIIFYIFAAWNIVVFALYGIDKWKSTHNRWRIKESTLLWTAFLMGGIGAMVGMSIFRHKTKHLKFKILIPLAIIFNIAVVIGSLCIAKGYLQTFQGQQI